MIEFPEKNWKKGGLEKLLRKLRKTGSTNWRHGSSRPKHACTEENVTSVEELVQSQEGQPQTHHSTGQIAREMHTSQSSVMRIIHRDLDLKCLKRRHAQELTEANCRSKQLLQRYSDSDVDFIWFTDEKVFTVATPKNEQNDRLYAPAAMKKRDVTAERLLRTRVMFCQSLMVSVGVSKLGCTHLIFLDPGMKINGCYYREVLLSQQLLVAQCVRLPGWLAASLAKEICHMASLGLSSVVWTRWRSQHLYGASHLLDDQYRGMCSRHPLLLSHFVKICRY